MALILRKAMQGYLFLFDEITDPRTKTWVLVAKPYQTLMILGLYLMFVLKWGPKWMKNREPFNLDRILIIYNALQVLSCLYLFVAGLKAAWLRDYKWFCEPVDFSVTPKALRVASLVNFYYRLKILDLLDTVFFVLRKKFNQISFLHIYHHTGMVILIWAKVTYMPGGHGTLIGVINGFVHVVMYSYYLLTVAIPSIKNALWLKKYVTQLQIVCICKVFYSSIWLAIVIALFLDLQFLWFILHMGVLIFKTDCEYPRWIAAIFIPQNLFILLLFIDFYIKTYIRKNKENPSVANVIENSNLHEYKNEINNNDNGINKLTRFNDRFGLNNNDLDRNFNCNNDNHILPCINGKNIKKDYHKLS